MSVREGLRFEGALESDCAPLAELVEAMLAAGRRHPLPPRSDPRRTGRGAERNRPGRPRGHRDRRGGDSRGRAGGRGLRTAGPRSALRGQRGPAGGVRAGRRGRSGAGGHATPSRRRRPVPHRHGHRRRTPARSSFAAASAAAGSSICSPASRCRESVESCPAFLATREISVAGCVTLARSASEGSLWHTLACASG